jgi:hypothetical protein
MNEEHNPPKSEVLTPPIETKSKEGLVSLEPFVNNFLKELGEDHPQLARKIESERLPDYVRNVQILWEEFQATLAADNKNTGDEQVQSILQQKQPDREFIDAVVGALNKLRYISNEETKSVMSQYAAEVEEVLLSDPNVVLIFETDFMGDGSETYFAKMVQQMLSPQLRGRVRFSSDDSPKHVPDLLRQQRFIVYKFDDSSNSGSQVISSIRNFIAEYGQYSKPLDFRVKLVASGRENLDDYVKERVDSWASKNDFSDVEYSLNSEQKYLNDRVDILYKGHKVSWGTSILFGHKIQDNLPGIYLSLSETDRRDKPHLFQFDVDIKPPYKNE